jgi:lipopolysaccharide export system protein LptC
MKRFLFFLVVLAALSGSYWWQRQLPERDVRRVVAPVPSPPRSPSVIAEDVDLKIREQGKLVWQLTIAKAHVPTDNSTAWATGLKRGVYFRDDKPYLTVTAGQLHYNPATQNIVVRDCIAVNGTDGFSLKTTQLRWDKQLRRIVCPDAAWIQVNDLAIQTPKVFFYPDEKKLVCPDGVTVIGKNAQLRGDRLAANLDTAQVDIEGNVQGVFRIQRTRRPPTPAKEGV